MVTVRNASEWHWGAVGGGGVEIGALASDPADRLPDMLERVLVLPRSDVPESCDFRGIRAGGPDDLAELRASIRRRGRYLDRALAEVSPDLKQIIPYVVLRDGPLVFLMNRTDAGGDPRLHRKASIGVGGHLNPVDAGEDALMAGLRREWAEELDADWDPEFELIGMLNDDTNSVGSVHLGIVFRVEAAGRAVDVREHDKLVGAFATPDEVADAWDSLETWSQLVAEAMGLGGRVEARG
jgi:predicted NUDIX family phosphoesterase